MPDKEGAQEKSTTKEVVNKKQKQMMGEEGYDVARDEGRVKPSKDKKDATSYPVSDEVRKTQKKNEGPSALEIVKKKYGKAVMDVEKKKNVSEEGKSLLSTPGLDKLKKIKDFKSNADRVFDRKSPNLTKVAESFGGEIVGEPVELDEGVASFITRVAKYAKKPSARKTFQQFVDLVPPAVKTQLNKLRPKIRKLNRQLDQSKGFDKIGDVEKGNVTSFVPDTPIKKPFKPLKPLKDFIRTGTEKAKTQFQKIKDTFKTKKTKKDTSYDLSKDYNVSRNKNKSKFGTKTKVAAGTGTGLGVGTLIGSQTKKKGAGAGKFRPRLPQTSHNIGRTSNPQ